MASLIRATAEIEGTAEIELGESVKLHGKGTGHLNDGTIVELPVRYYSRSNLVRVTQDGLVISEKPSYSVPYHLTGGRVEIQVVALRADGSNASSPASCIVTVRGKSERESAIVDPQEGVHLE